MLKTAICGWSARRGNRHITKTLLVMKLTLLFLTVGFLNVYAKGVSQNVSFSGQNVPLKEAFTSIEKQTGFVFLYTEPVISLSKPISVRAENVSLEKLLVEIFKSQPLDYEIVGKSIFISSKVNPGLAVDLKSTAGVLMPPGSVQGRVTNEDGEPLAGASVTVKGTNLGTKTDNNGYYKIDGVTAGDYILEISYVGFATKITSIKVTESGSAAVDIKLAPSLVNLDQITVASTLSSRKIRSVPTTLAVLTQADLKNRNLNNIANVLEAIPGIIIQPGSEWDNSGGSTRIPSILIRGTSPGAPIKYLVDGIEIVADANSALSILQTMDPNTIEKIEVLKGPMASTLYGSGGAGGIISITTKKGKGGKTKVNFKTMFTDQSNKYADYKGYQQDYSLNVSGGNEQFNYLIGAAYNLYPLTKLTDINNGIDTKKWSYNVRLGGKINNIAADLSIQYGNQKRGFGSTYLSDYKYAVSIGSVPPSTVPVVPVVQDYRSTQRNFLTSLHLTHTLADNWYQDLTVGYNISNNSTSNYRSDYAGNYANNEQLFSKINARYFMFYDHSWSAALKTNITAGFEYNGYETHAIGISTTAPLTNFFTSSTPAIGGAAFFTKSPYSSTGYFAEAVTGLRNNLFLTTGIRYDVNPAYGDNVGAYAQPRVGLSYIIESGNFKIKPRVVWGVSSTAPDPTYKITTINVYPDYAYTYISEGNPDIKPQRSEGYEFGADIFYGSNYSLNVTYYDQKIKDLITGFFYYTIDINTGWETDYAHYYNIAKAINKGLEVSAKVVTGPFTLDLSYTQTTSKWGDVTGQAVSATVYPHAPNLGIPKNSFFARLGYKIPSLLPWTKKGGNISLDWRYNGSALNYNGIGYGLARAAWLALPTPRPEAPNVNNYLIWQKGYSYFNLRADYSLTDFAALYVDVQNLLDKQGSINGQNSAGFPGRRFNLGFNLIF